VVVNFAVPQVECFLLIYILRFFTKGKKSDLLILPQKRRKTPDNKYTITLTLQQQPLVEIHRGRLAEQQWTQRHPAIR
jgi:hypothetical protein